MKELFIEKNLLLKNLAVIKHRAGGARLMAVLKNNASGLGLLQMAHFWKEAGITFFGVGDPADAAALRTGGFAQEEILLLRSTALDYEIEQLLDLHVIASVGSQEAAMALSGIAEKRGTVAEAHLKVDCGLGRYGFLPQESDKILAVYKYMQRLAFSGVYTHLPSGLPTKRAARCLADFEQVLALLRSNKLETGLVHALGSTALFGYKNPPQYDMVRVASAISGRVRGKTGLSQVGVVRAPLTETRWVPAGHMVGSRTKTRKAVKIGIIPVGYADGFDVDRPERGFGAGVRAFLSAFESPSVRLENGGELRVLGMAEQNSIVVDLTRVDRPVGTMVWVHSNALFCGDMPRVLR